MPSEKICAAAIPVVIVIGIVSILMLNSFSAPAARSSSITDYSFATENIDLGGATGQASRNAEDGAYETLYESDQQADLNISASTESVTTGTAAGGTFPSQIDTKDDAWRTYTEANANPADSAGSIRPTSDAQKQFTCFPASPVSSWDKLDEATVGGNGDTDYVYPSSTANQDWYNMADIGTPSGSPTYHVVLWIFAERTSSQAANIQAGLRIGTTNYGGISVSPANGVYTNYSYEWTTNPAGGAWTLAQVQALVVYLATSDISPVPRVSQVACSIQVIYTANYNLLATITWSGTTTNGGTTAWMLNVQGKRGDTENFLLQLYDYVALTYSTRITVAAASDTDYSYTLTANERSGTGEIKVKMIGNTEAGDTTQSVLSLDYMRIQRVDYIFKGSIRETATGIPAYGQLDLRVKGYTSDAENWNVQLYNFGTTVWDTIFSKTDLSNTLSTVSLDRAKYVSSGEVRAKFDNQATPDGTQSIFYLDAILVRHTNLAPAITSYGKTLSVVNQGSEISFWATYTDADNDAPSYMRVVIGGSNYAMVKNNSGDSAYFDGCLYYYSTSALSPGAYNFYFAAKDATNGEVTTGTDTFTVNAIPTLSGDTTDPATGNPGSFRFKVVYTDADNDAPSSIKAVIDTVEYAMTKDDLGDNTYTDGCAYHYDKTMTGGTHPYHFHATDTWSPVVETASKDLIVNTAPTLSNYQRLPADPVYPTIQLTFSMTYTDPDGDLPTAIRWREDGGATQNLTMVETDPGDTDVINGKAYQIQMYLAHGSYDYDFYASDGNLGVSGGSDSISIQNRAPSITDKCSNPSDAYRNSGWSFDFNATDLDSDTIAWARAGPSWLAINPSTGILSGTTTDAPGTYSFTIYANDSYGGSGSYSFDLHINNRAPAITDSLEEDHAYRSTYWFYDFSFSDPDSDSVTWAKSGNASFLSVNPSTGLLQGTTSSVLGWYHTTVWANDSYGGSDSLSFDLYLDNRNPEITTTCNSDTTYRSTFWDYDCDATDPDGDPVSFALSGNSSSFLTIDPSTGYISGTTPATFGWFAITIWANDSYGGSDSQEFNLYVSLNHAPEITTDPSTLSVRSSGFWGYDCNATDPESDDLIFALSGNSSSFLSINPSTGYISGTGPETLGWFVVRVYANDSYGGTTFQQFGLNVTLNSNPEIFSEPPTTSTFSETFWDYDCNATDLEADEIAYALSGNSSSFLSIDPETGYVSGITPGIPGYYVIRIYANDSYGGTTFQQFNLFVNLTIENPVITSEPASNSTYRSELWSYDCNATGGTGPITYELSGNSSSFLTIDPSTGYVSGTTPGTFGYYVVRIYANDSDSGTTFQQFLLYVSLNHAPEITTEPITNATYRSVLWGYHCDATDSESDGMTYELSGNSSAFLEMESSTGYLSGITPNTQGWFVVRIYANDSYGGTTYQEFRLYCLNRAPLIQSNANSTQAMSTYYAYRIFAVDPDGDILSYSFSTNAPFLELDGKWIDGLVNQSSFYWCKLWVNDSYGGSTLQEWFIEIVADPPNRHTPIETDPSKQNQSDDLEIISGGDDSTTRNLLIVVAGLFIFIGFLLCVSLIQSRRYN